MTLIDLFAVHSLCLFFTLAVSDVEILDTVLINHGLQEAGRAAESPPEDAAEPPAKQEEPKQVSRPSGTHHGPSDELLGSRHKVHEARFFSRLFQPAAPTAQCPQLQQPLITTC